MTNGDLSLTTNRCIGNCVEKWGQFKCTTTWSGSEATCVTTTVATRRYRTETNQECISDCDTFGNKYQWCTTSNSEWGKCSRNIGLQANRTHGTNNRYITCADKCTKDGSSSARCGVIGDRLEDCDQDDITHTFNYPTEGGSVCATRCKLYGFVSFCYTSTGTWDKCFLNPSYDGILNIIDSNLKQYCPFGEYEHSGSGGYRRCRRNRHARSSETLTKQKTSCILIVMPTWILLP